MKKTLTFAAVCLAGCLTFTLTGCSSNMRNPASLSSNWYSDRDIKGIQPPFINGEENFKSEKLVYTVKQVKKSESAYYSVTYEDGTYTTEFYADKISAEKLKEITAEEWHEEYEAHLSDDGYLVLYRYETRLEIPSVTYDYGGAEKRFDNEYRHTVSYFMPVKEYLSPVYSYVDFKSTSPCDPRTDKENNCYKEYDRSYESFYNFAGSEVKTLMDDKLNRNKDQFFLSGLKDGLNSVFDTSYIDIVARGMRNLSNSLNQAVTLYYPFMQLADFTLTGSSSPLCDDEEEAQSQLENIQNILKENNLFKEEQNEDGTPKKLTTIAVNISYNDNVISGVAQRYWFAVSDKNTAHTVMVKYSSPIAYNNGVLDYVLKSVDSMPEV